MEVFEDYVEAIADLSSEGGEARVMGLSRCLGVTHVTVHRTVGRLRRSGYVKARPYGAIFLTPKGRKLAVACKKRHEIVVSFLRSLGVSKKTAEIDAEGIEHHISPETLRAFVRTLESRCHSR